MPIVARVLLSIVLVVIAMRAVDMARQWYSEYSEMTQYHKRRVVWGWVRFWLGVAAGVVLLSVLDHLT